MNCNLFYGADMIKSEIIFSRSLTNGMMDVQKIMDSLGVTRTWLDADGYEQMFGRPFRS